jgi:predicted short-subunit dehydrogenase-like oxidoreductase (DUF2520 family)
MPTLILITVPDAAVVEVGERLAALNLEKAPVLHTSGVLDAKALEPIRRLGSPVGSVHPMAAVPRSSKAGERLSGAWFGIEGDVPACDAAESLVEALGGKSLRIPVGAKAAYHASAVIASNFVVVLLSVAERLMEANGVDRTAARAALAALAAGAIANVEDPDPVNALTGPLTRGDAETLALHLRGLSPADRRLYSVLAREALGLARLQGLAEADARRVVAVLDSEAS